MRIGNKKKTIKNKVKATEKDSCSILPSKTSLMKLRQVILKLLIILITCSGILQVDLLKKHE